MRKSASKNYIETEAWNKSLEPGATLEGYYVQSETFNGKFGETTKYTIKTDDGYYGVYGSASLDRQFKNIPEGCFVWITYKGEEPTKNGRTVKVYDVDYDDELTAE